MRIVVQRGAVDLAMRELGPKLLCACIDQHKCKYCREAVEKALKAALGEVFPKAEIEIRQ